jgi:hypothetical protein
MASTCRPFSGFATINVLSLALKYNELQKMELLGQEFQSIFWNLPLRWPTYLGLKGKKAKMEV